MSNMRRPRHGCQLTLPVGGRVPAVRFLLLSSLLSLLLLSSLAVSVDGWVVLKTPSHTTFTTTTITTTTTTQLEARKAKGTLGILANEGLDTVKTPKRTVPKKRSGKSKNNSSLKTTMVSSSSSSSSTSSSTKSGVSPALAEWMASTTQDDTASAMSVQDTTEENDDDDTTVASFEVFEAADDKQGKDKSSKQRNSNSSSSSNSNKGARRIKQSERQAMEVERAANIDTAMKALTKVLEEESNNLSDILKCVQSLLELPSDNLRTLLQQPQQKQNRLDYRLAWVGGDDAICHFGTGLHKVPLARLQEIFFSCMGKNRVQVSEVISILGPFPNVKNILQGTTKLSASSSEESEDGVVATMTIVMDSMVDGTGKEILAGTEDNVRCVDLQVYFADERAIVAVVPPPPPPMSEDTTTTTTNDASRQRRRRLVRDNPLEANGANVLVFVREPDLDARLDALRVS